MNATHISDKARQLVVDTYNEQLVWDQQEDRRNAEQFMWVDEVYVVWQTKVLQNWKALLSTDRPDGKYYEVTYDGEKARSYIDTYIKEQNTVIYDEHYNARHEAGQVEKPVTLRGKVVGNFDNVDVTEEGIFADINITDPEFRSQIDASITNMSIQPAPLEFEAFEGFDVDANRTVTRITDPKHPGYNHPSNYRKADNS